jgi:hypothetical protein
VMVMMHVIEVGKGEGVVVVTLRVLMSRLAVHARECKHVCEEEGRTLDEADVSLYACKRELAMGHLRLGEFDCDSAGVAFLGGGAHPGRRGVGYGLEGWGAIYIK